MAKSNVMDTIFKIASMKNISQSDLARKLNLTRMTVSNLKTQGHEPRFSTVLDFADAMNCEIILVDKDSGLKYKL